MATSPSRSAGARRPGSRAGAGRWAALAAALVLAGCGGATAAPDFHVRGMNVLVNSTAAFTQTPDFAARVESTVDAALEYWGGDWSQLAGKTITFDGGEHVSCAGHVEAIGCYDGSISVSTSDLTTPFSCVEETVLVHEIGHAVIGDPDHTDPRWMDFGRLSQALAGRTGYGANGATACTIYPNVWRHPPAQG